MLRRLIRETAWMHPALDAGWAALIQAGVWVAGTVILSCGVAAIFLGRTDLEFIAIAGSLIIIADMIVFAYLVFRSETAVTRTIAAAVPAE